MHFENTSKNSKKSQKLPKYKKFRKNHRSKKSIKFIFTYPYQVSKTSNHRRNISPVIKNLPLNNICSLQCKGSRIMPLILSLFLYCETYVYTVEYHVCY